MFFRSSKSDEQVLKDRLDLYKTTVDRLKKRIEKLTNDNNRLQESFEELQMKAKVEKEHFINEINFFHQDLILSKERIKSLKEELEHYDELDNHSIRRSARVFSELIDYCNLKISLPEASTEETISAIIQRIELSLGEYGITLNKEYVGTFDPSSQRIIEVIETTDPSLDNQVVKVLSPGYWLHDTCILPQGVAIYSLKP